MKSKIIGAILLMLVAGCHKDEEFTDTLPSCKETTVFTSFPIAMDHVVNFIPLGHYNPPGHVFPSDHHYFNIERGFGNIPVYAPCDGWITYVTENQLPAPVYREYAFELHACREIKMKFGHITRLENFFVDQLGEVKETDSYSTGGHTYNLKIYKPQIEVKAGQKIAELLDVEGVTGMDFGSFDRRVQLPFIKPERWEDYGYASTVSFLNYATDEIRNTIFHMIQFDNGGYPLRTTPPLEGKVCYDVQGTAQGMWFLPWAPLYPEDPHLGLLRNNYYPEKNVISMGISVPGLLPIPYEFYPEAAGTHNRSFDKITPDGKIYTFSNFTDIWEQPLHSGAFDPNGIILIQLINTETLRVELQTTADGPPWSFKNNYCDFIR